MATITIPKKLAREGDLVVIPRREYEALVRLKKMKEFVPAAAQKKALAKAEKNLRGEKTLSFYELTRKLGFTN